VFCGSSGKILALFICNYGIFSTSGIKDYYEKSDVLNTNKSKSQTKAVMFCRSVDQTINQFFFWNCPLFSQQLTLTTL
jgi:hypothetical protein